MIWDWIATNAPALQVILTFVLVLVTWRYVQATVNLWRESRLSNTLSQLQYIPQIIVTTENPTRWGYSLVFINEGRISALVQFDLFIDYAGGDVFEKSNKPIKHLEFVIPPGGRKKIPIDTFHDLKRRGLGQYTPHILRVEGIASVKVAEGFGEPITQEIKERFHCIMRNKVPLGKPIHGNELLDPQKWEWEWLIFNLSDKYTENNEVEPWPEDQLPEEYRPTNNNTTIYMQKVLQKRFGILFKSNDVDKNTN